MKLKDRVAIITGGSRGIGKTIAEFFAREGAHVFILSRNRQEIAGAVREIAAITDKKISGLVCDIADAKAVARVVGAIGKKCKHIDVVVNCAGIQAPIGPFVGNDTGEWEKNIAVNLLGTMHVSKAALPFMMKRGAHGARPRGGSIINFAGGGATSSRPNFSAYAVAKIGVVKLTEILADELKTSHVRVNAISPGAVNTEMLTEVLAAGARAGKEELASSKKRLAAGGTSPELAAALAVFLASNDSQPLTGRLISAPWDDWKKWNKKEIEKIMKTDRFTLRRKI